MRALLMTLAAFVVLALVPAASAQMSHSSMSIVLDAPDRALTQGLEVMTLQGVTTYTGDLLQYQYTNGVPISYVVTRNPAWLSVTVSPASDTIPLPPPVGPTVTVQRTFVVTIVLDPNFHGEAIDTVEVTVSQGPAIATPTMSVKTQVPIVANVPDEEPCPVDAHPDLAALASQAEAAYSEYKAREESPSTSGGDEVSVQNATASPISLPWIAVAAFALVGAGAGLALRRRFPR